MYKMNANKSLWIDDVLLLKNYLSSYFYYKSNPHSAEEKRRKSCEQQQTMIGKQKDMLKQLTLKDAVREQKEVIIAVYETFHFLKVSSYYYLKACNFCYFSDEV